MHPALAQVWRLERRHVFPVPSTPDLFNPYRDEDPEHDRPGAAAIRRENLRRYLASFRDAPELIAIGEAPGPRGCRFSGIPFTSEAVLLEGGHPCRGAERTGLRERPWREASGGVLWGVLGEDAARVLVWNAVPLFPHPPGDALGIRTPRTSEVRAFVPWLRGVVDALRPVRVVAIGRTAEKALRLADVPHTGLRHPSHGGVREFSAGLRRLLDPRRNVDGPGRAARTRTGP